MKKFILITLALMLTACSIGAKSELEQNQKKWQDINIMHYRFKVFVGCFCAFTQDMPVSIEVQNDNIVSITRSNGTLVSPKDSEFEAIARYGSIKRLFSELKTDLDGRADQVTVKYDSTYDYPSQISIDFVEQAVDDELSLRVSDFQKLD